MRKFSLYLNGVEYKMNAEDGFSFNYPAGLGVTFGYPMVDLRNGFFKPAAKDIIPQASIAGDITMMGTTVLGLNLTPYEQYQYFMSLLSTAKKIEFAYTPFGAGEYRTEVEIEYISKSEMKGGWLTCPVSFRMLTPWYSVTNINVPLAVDEDNFNLYTAEYKPRGDIGAAFEIIAEGGGTPAFIIANLADNTQLGVVFFGADSQVRESGTLNYSTKYNDSHALFTRNNATIDLIDDIELNEFEIFPKLPPWVESKISVSYLENVNKPTSISVNIYEYYRSV